MRTTNCYTCKMEFGMPDSFYKTMLQLREKGAFHCPAGHVQHFCTGESELDKMRRRAEKAEQDRAYWQDRTREVGEAKATVERQASAARGQVTKIKNRIGNGVCPCCNRTFSNLMRHMAAQHKDYKKEAA